MTYRRYNISRGAQPRGPVEIVEAVGSPLTSGSVQVVIDFNGVAPIQSKREAVILLRQIIERIERGNWPPA
jgi:hypothetical protein